MKYAKHLAFLCVIGATLGLVACGGTLGQAKSKQLSNEAPATLISTQEYLPAPKLDAEGVFLPYVPRENPYLAQRGRVKKESVAKFIEIKRAQKQKQYAQAEKLLQELIVEDRSLSGPWVTLGDIALEQHKVDQAGTYFQEAITRNSRNINAYMRLAQVQRMQGKFLLAQNTYAKALTLWPDFPEAHLNLAVLYDVYLNHPLRAQKHMEAYQFLTGGENKQVAEWLTEIQARTGVPITLVVEKPKAESKPLS